MALAFGSLTASKIYLGATEVALAYLGATQVYTSSAFSAEAQNYFDRLDTATDTTYIPYKQPLANYIDSLVALGGAYWDDMLSSTSFVGVGIQGITVPLRSGMPTLTNNNFVDADLDQLNGLKGDGLTKQLKTGIFDNQIAQNDGSISIYQTEAITNGQNYSIGTGYSGAIGGGTFVRDLGTTIQVPIHGGLISKGTAWVSGLIGGSRSSSTTQTQRTNQTDYVFASTSLAQTAFEGFLFKAGTSPRTNPRIATYHFGPALNLATLEGLQATLLAEIAGIGFSTEAANYFGRLVNAGDSTFYAYRQPLANYIDSLVALGGAYWDTMLSATSFVGVGIEGVVVPLRSGMTVPTNNNFVTADLDQLTGLKGDGSTKYLNTGVYAGSSLSQNDASISTYLTSDRDVGATSLYIASSASNFSVVNNATGFRSRHFNSTLSTNGTSTSVGGLIGISRDNASDYDWYDVGATGTNADASVSQTNSLVGVFAAGDGSLINSSRLATYHVGPSLNLATLEGLQATLISEIAAI